VCVEDLSTDRVAEKDAGRGKQTAHANPCADFVGFGTQGSQDGRLQSRCKAREEAVEERECDDSANAPTRDPCERQDCGTDCRSCVGVEQADPVSDESWGDSTSDAACVQYNESVESEVLVDTSEGTGVLLDVEEGDVEAQETCEGGYGEDVEWPVSEGVEIKHLSGLL
jgi:hypothetical protein